MSVEQLFALASGVEGAWLVALAWVLARLADDIREVSRAVEELQGAACEGSGGDEAGLR